MQNRTVVSWLDWYQELTANTSSSATAPSNSTQAGQPGTLLYEAIVQGVLVCLFTTVGGVMLIVFCLIIVQECKLVWLWAVRTRHEDLAPPSYLEVTKPPSYSSCRVPAPAPVPPASPAETEPPAYSELYTRQSARETRQPGRPDNSLDRIVICGEAGGSLVHSNTVSGLGPGPAPASVPSPAPAPGYSNVRPAPATSLFSIESPKHQDKKRFYSLQMFRLGSASSSASSLNDSVPLLDNSDPV